MRSSVTVIPEDKGPDHLPDSSFLPFIDKIGKIGSAGLVEFDPSQGRRSSSNAATPEKREAIIARYG
jgi:hypothetical protein